MAGVPGWLVGVPEVGVAEVPDAGPKLLTRMFRHGSTMCSAMAGLPGATAARTHACLGEYAPSLVLIAGKHADPHPIETGMLAPCSNRTQPLDESIKGAVSHHTDAHTTAGRGQKQQETHTGGMQEQLKDKAQLVLPGLWPGAWPGGQLPEQHHFLLQHLRDWQRLVLPDAVHDALLDEACQLLPGRAAALHRDIASASLFKLRGRL